MFTAALFTTARIPNQPKCPLREKWTKKTWYIYTMEYCMCYIFSCVQLLRLHSLWHARLLCPWDSLGKNIGVGCHFLLQMGPQIVGRLAGASQPELGEAAS